MIIYSGCKSTKKISFTLRFPLVFFCDSLYRRPPTAELTHICANYTYNCALHKVFAQTARKGMCNSCKRLHKEMQAFLFFFLHRI